MAVVVRVRWCKKKKVDIKCFWGENTLEREEKKQPEENQPSLISFVTATALTATTPTQPRERMTNEKKVSRDGQSFLNCLDTKKKVFLNE